MPTQDAAPVRINDLGVDHGGRSRPSLPSGRTEPLTIPRMVDEAARLYGDRPAVVAGGVVTSYRRLADLVLRAARAFHATGVGRGDRVAIWAPNGLEFIVAMLGAQTTGASVVPLNTRYRGPEAFQILTRARVTALVVANGFLGNDYLEMLSETAGEAGPGGTPQTGIPTLDIVVDVGGGSANRGVLSWDDFLAKADIVPEQVGLSMAAAVSPDDVCDILFTSGTTGVPKGVMSAHRQTIGAARVWAERASLTVADHYAVVNPMFHGFGYKAGVIACLTTGATIHPVTILDVDDLLALVERERISVLPGPPTVFTSLLGHPSLNGHDLGSLRLAVVGAAAVPATLLRQMSDRLGFDRIAQGYGLTECMVATLTHPDAELEHVATTAGPVVAGLEIRITDTAGRDRPIGADGEVLLRGDTVMLGYLEDAEATRQVIDADGWLSTGDIGRLDEHGCLTITGRMKDMFTVGGFNVYPAEVEAAICTHPDVVEAAVVAVPDERMGSIGRAHVVARVGTDPSPEELIAWCRRRLANFKVPRDVLLRARLPRNAGGKVVKEKLLDE